MRRTMRVFATALALFAGPALAQGKKVVVGINSMTAIYWPTYVARAKGLFARNGIDADVVLTGSPVSAVQQIVSRSIDIGHPTLYVAVNALAHDADITLVGCIVNTLPYSMISPPEVQSARDLVGKKVILAFRTDVLTLIWREWLKAQGVAADDIDQIYDAQAANRYAAMARRQASAAMLNAPFDLRALAEGDRTLLDFGQQSKGYAMAVAAVRPDYMKANPDAVRGYLKATQEAIDWLYDPANRAEAIAILARDTKQDAGVAAATYDDYIVRRKPYDRTLDLPDFYLQRTLEGAITLGDVPKGFAIKAGVKDLSLRPQ
jgi:ABC-type nitrate/sulfonate/bicarbonate transport system substrate-binding protein